MKGEKTTGPIAYIRKSFKRKLLVCFLAVALVPLTLSGIFFIQMFQMQVKQDYEKKLAEQAQVIQHALTEALDEFDRTMLVLCQELSETRALEEETGISRISVYGKLYEETAHIRALAQFDVYSSDGRCLYSTGNGTVHSDLPAYWGILRLAAAHPEEMIIRGQKEYGKDRDILLRTARAVLREDGACAGFLTAALREENLEQMLHGTYSSQDGVCILNQFWEPVYRTGTAAREDIGTILRRQRLEGEEIVASYHNNSVYLAPIGETGLYLVLLRPEILSSDTTRTMYQILFLLIAVSLMLCLVVSARMSASLAFPVGQLNEAMEEVQEGRLDTRIPSGRMDEFGQLSRNFNTMTKELKRYMEKQVSQQKELNDVSIAMMQAQLNPHFLYNTLDTMKWVAKANHIPEIATLASKLAKILRTSISREQFITLKEEIQLVECYVEIQKIRFSGKFHFEYQLPEELKQHPVPKLVIQPIVENAVIHGLEDCEEGHIQVIVYESEGRLCIDVADDGCGISQEMIDCLKNRNWEQMSGHIGFFNVDRIIRLHYGEEYGLKVRRRASGGTRITIEMPL